MALGVKQGRSLFETTKEELEQLKGTPSPLSPAAAKTAGATPDQAKMAGGREQKQAAFQRAQEPAPGQPETLQQQQRITPTQGPAEFQQLAQTAQAKADRLQKLGSLGTRVENLIQSYQTQVTTEEGGAPRMLGRSVNQEQLAETFSDLPPDQLAAKEQALQQYAALETPSQQDLINLANTLGVGLEALEGGALAGLYTGGPEAFAGATEGIIPTEVTIGEIGLELQPDELDAIAQDLGIDQAALMAMKPTEFQQALKDLETSQLNMMDSLRVEYNTASPNRQAEILAQLRALDVTGQAAAEIEVEQVQADVEQDLQVEFMGKQYSIGELLGDEVISDQITLAATSPTALEELRESSPQLAEWIEANQEAIKETALQMGRDVTTLKTVNDTMTETRQELGPLADAFDLPEGLVTEEQLKQAQADLAANEAIGFLREHTDIMTQFQENPDLFAQIKDMSREQLDALKRATDRLGTDQDLANILGMEIGGLILDPAKAREVEQLADTWQMLDQAPGLKAILKGLGPQAKEKLAGIASAGKPELILEGFKQLQDNPALSAWIPTDDTGIPDYNTLVLDGPQIMEAWKHLKGETEASRENLTSHPNFSKFMKEGWITPQNATKLTQGALADMDEQLQEIQVWTGEPDVRRISDWFFGRQIQDPGTMAKEFERTFNVASKGETKEARAFNKTMLSIFDRDKDGRIDLWRDFYPEVDVEDPKRWSVDELPIGDFHARVQKMLQKQAQHPGQVVGKRDAVDYEGGNTYQSPLERLKNLFDNRKRLAREPKVPIKSVPKAPVGKRPSAVAPKKPTPPPKYKTVYKGKDIHGRPIVDWRATKAQKRKYDEAMRMYKRDEAKYKDAKSAYDKAKARQQAWDKQKKEYDSKSKTWKQKYAAEMRDYKTRKKRWDDL